MYRNAFYHPILTHIGGECMTNKKWALLAAVTVAGFFSGFLNGLLGTGGGIAIVLFLLHMTKNSPDPGRTSKKVFATANTIVLIVSLCSLILYVCFGKFTVMTVQNGYPYFLMAIPGGLLGAVWLEKCKPMLIRKLFGTLLLIAGIRLLF